MFRHLTRVAALIAVSGILLMGTTSAQTARRTLSQRLEQFRDDLVGEGAADDGSQDTGLPDVSPPVVQRPVVARPSASPSAAQSPAAQVPTLASRPKAVGDTVNGLKVPSGKGSSRRTAKPGYKPSQSQPTPADSDASQSDEADSPSNRSAQEPTLAKPTVAKPTLARPTLAKPTASKPTLAKPTLARQSEVKRSEPTAELDEEESPTPRLARAVRPDVAPPASQPLPTKSVVQRPKVAQQPKSPLDGDVLFSAQSPMLSVEATGPHKVLIGKPAVFSVKLRNAGDVPANNVVVTVNIPPFAEVVEAQPTAGTTRSAAGTERNEPFEWRISRFESHGRETLTLKIIPRKSIPIDLAVQCTCTPEVSQTLVEVQEPKLVMTLSGPAEVHFGQTKIYKLQVSNPGNGDAENVLVNLLPIGRAAEGTASHRMGMLRAGDSKAIEVELTARQAGALMIRAQAFADGGLRAEASESVLVRRGGLQVEVEGPKVKYAGTNGTYRIHLTNPGDATAENVQVSAMLPPQAKYISSNSAGRDEADHGKVVWNAGNLQAGGERMLEVQFTLLSPGENRTQVVATGDGELSASAAVNTRVDALADLKLEVRDPQGPIPLGEDAVFEVIIRNRGTKSAEKIDLVVFFSEGLEATSVQGGAHEIGRGQVFFKTIPFLAAGSETVYRVHAKADRAANHVFRAEVVCETLQTKLAAEETTRFYGDESADGPAAPATPDDVELQPIPKE